MGKARHCLRDVERPLVLPGAAPGLPIPSACGWAARLQDGLLTRSYKALKRSGRWNPWGAGPDTGCSPPQTWAGVSLRTGLTGAPVPPAQGTPGS